MARWHAPLGWLGGPSLVADVGLEVADGIITDAQAGAGGTGASRFPGILLPGFVSAHSHAFHRAMRGKTHSGRGDFWAWRALMYAVAGRLAPASYRRLASEVYAEMLRQGFTTVGEFHYVHHQTNGDPYEASNAMGRAVLEAAAAAGIRLTLLDTCYLTAGVDGAPPNPQQLRFSDGSIGRWANRVRDLRNAAADRPLTRIGVAAHSVRAVAATDLPTVAKVAAELEAPVHVHVSEQPAENDACLAQHGVSPTRLLADTGVLGPHAVAVHATHLLEGDIELYAGSGTGVCLCPTTERDLGDGIGPAAELRAAGVQLSIGCDSHAVVDPFDETRAVELNDRLRLGRRGIHAPEALMSMGTMNGLKALGWGDHDPLAPGSPADFISVDLGGVVGFDPADGIAGVLFGAGAGCVTDVVVGGRAVVRDGHNVSGHSPTGLRAAIQAVTS